MNMILVVDDDAGIRRILQTLLTKAGYRVQLAPSGQVALELAAASPPNLILLDVMMPGMDGFEVCRRLRADSCLADVPILLVTALEEGEARLRGLEAGADGVVSKPFSRDQLLARVGQWVNNDSSVQQQDLAWAPIHRREHRQGQSGNW